jgi:thiol-disulfide isomerase/thioredoxin
MKPVRLLVWASVMMTLGANLGQTQDKKISAVPVTYEGLKQEILKHRGKVVVVDFWGTFCPPCMAAFPKFIKLHKELESKGLVVISVSLDPLDPEDKEARNEKLQAVDRFLTKQDSPLRNLILDDPTVEWTKKLGTPGLPCYFVFDRQGRWVRFKDEAGKPISYAELEQTIHQMLAEK